MKIEKDEWWFILAIVICLIVFIWGIKQPSHADVDTPRVFSYTQSII
jgi:hypothetical protein